MLGTAAIILESRFATTSPMTRHRLRAQLACTLSTAVLAAALLCPAHAQNSGGFLDNLFNRNQPQEQAGPSEAQAQTAQPDMDSGDGAGLSARVGRIENALRQLTGTIEQLQHQNQVLQMQLKRMQDDTEFRLQQLGSRAGGQPATSAPAMPPSGPANIAPNQRSDVFDPAQHPNAPGAPRALGNTTAMAGTPQIRRNEPQTDAQVGAPGGRAAGAPLDLSTLAGSGSAQPPAPIPSAPMTAPPPAQRQAALPPPTRQVQSALPPPPSRNTSATGMRLATLPPSASPADEYELAHGYVLHKDYALAEQAFRDFLRKYPDEAKVPDAQYWLGESLFQQQHYRDAAESFLAVSTKYEKSARAPESLLRLGQSLSALHQKEAACATFAEVGRKYPRAAANVKRDVSREQKRSHC
jgi:tol-pal system protein YbgF